MTTAEAIEKLTLVLALDGVAVTFALFVVALGVRR
jgi:hypothetical protein